MSDSAKVAMISTLDAARADVEALFQWLGFQRMEIAVLRSGACEVFHVSTAKEGLSWITQYERDCNIYFCTNEISPEHFGTNRRANAHDVTNPRVLLLDIDPAQVGLPPGRAFLAALAILPKVWEFDLRPLLINSGRGAQILFRIPNGADRVGTWQQFRDGYADVLERIPAGSTQHMIPRGLRECRALSIKKRASARGSFRSREIFRAISRQRLPASDRI